MNKCGTTEWTMSKLITMVLAVFLMALIIYGTQTKGFGPLRDNIEGRFDEVLILLNIRDDPSDISCGDSFVQNIDGVGEGMFYPCEDSCTFVLVGDNELLNFSNFSIKDGGISVFGDGVSDDDEAYRFGTGEAGRHRKAYELLKEAVGEFLLSENMGYDEFVGRMEFDEDRVLFFEVHDKGTNTFYEYDGDGWMKSWKILYIPRIKVVSWVDVVDELWKVHNKYDITWNYEMDSLKRGVYDFENFKKSFNDSMIWWSSTRKSQNELLVNLRIVLADFPEVTFNGGSLKVKNGEVNPSSKIPMISFGEFGLYYKNGKPALVYNGEDSVVSGFVAIEDWQDFVKINKIYEHFKLRRCGV